MPSIQGIHGFVQLSRGVPANSRIQRIRNMIFDRHAINTVASFLYRGQLPEPAQTASFCPSVSNNDDARKNAPLDPFVSRLCPLTEGILVSRSTIRSGALDLKCVTFSKMPDLAGSLAHVADVQFDGTLDSCAILDILKILRASTLSDLPRKLDVFGIEVRGFKGMPYSSSSLFRRLSPKIGYSRVFQHLNALTREDEHFKPSMVVLNRAAEGISPAVAANLVNSWNPEAQKIVALEGPTDFQKQAIIVAGPRLTEDELIIIFQKTEGDEEIGILLLSAPACGRKFLLMMASEAWSKDQVVEMLKHPLSDDREILSEVMDFWTKDIGRMYGEDDLPIFVAMAGLKNAPFIDLAKLNRKAVRLALANNPATPTSVLDHLADEAIRLGRRPYLLSVIAKHPNMTGRKGELLEISEKLFDAEEDNAPGTGN